MSSYKNKLTSSQYSKFFTETYFFLGRYLHKLGHLTESGNRWRFSTYFTVSVNHYRFSAQSLIWKKKSEKITKSIGSDRLIGKNILSLPLFGTSTLLSTFYFEKQLKVSVENDFLYLPVVQMFSF